MEDRIQEIIQKIRVLIIQGKIKEALDQLVSYFPGDQDIINQISSRYNNLERDNKISDIISRADYKIERNQITTSILDILKVWESEEDLKIKEIQKKADYYYKQGISFLDEKKYREAKKAFNDAIFINKKFAAAYANRGLSRINLKEPFEAIEDIEYALQLDPDLPPWTLYNLGLLYIASKNFKDGCSKLKEAAERGHSRAKLDYDKQCKS